MDKLLVPANLPYSSSTPSSHTCSWVTEGSGGAPGSTEQNFKTMGLDALNHAPGRPSPSCQGLRQHLSERLRVSEEQTRRHFCFGEQGREPMQGGKEEEPGKPRQASMKAAPK